MTPDTLKALIQARMAELSITSNYQLHKLSGVSEQALGLYLSGKRGLTIKSLLPILEALDLVITPAPPS